MTVSDRDDAAPMAPADVRGAIRSYILSEFLDESDRDALTDDTALISSGVLNSLALIRLVAFVQKTFGVTIPPDEMNEDHLDSIAQMESVILGAKR